MFTSTKSISRLILRVCMSHANHLDKCIHSCCDAGPSAGRRQRPPCRRASGRNEAADVRATIEPCVPLRHNSVAQNQRFQLRKCQNARARGLRINHKPPESSLLLAKVEAVHEIIIRVCSWRMSSQRRCTNGASLPEA